MVSLRTALGCLLAAAGLAVAPYAAAAEFVNVLTGGTSGV